MTLQISAIAHSNSHGMYTSSTVLAKLLLFTTVTIPNQSLHTHIELQLMLLLCRGVVFATLRWQEALEETLEGNPSKWSHENSHKGIKLCHVMR